MTKNSTRSDRLNQQQSATPDMSWEKELAPKVSRGQIILSSIFYAIWTLFLLYLAIDRWFGGLQ